MCVLYSIPSDCINDIQPDRESMRNILQKPVCQSGKFQVSFSPYKTPAVSRKVHCIKSQVPMLNSLTHFFSTQKHTTTHIYTMAAGTPLGRGVFVPIPTFFKDNEDLDFDALEKHIQHLSNKGLAGIIFLGSMGEAVHLSDEERRQVIAKGAELVKKYDSSIKVLAGASAGSARHTIELTKQAADAGAEYVLVLPPSYYRGNVDSEAIETFFTRVADQSPVPVVIYNYPGVTQGVDITVQSLEKLAKHPNIVGVKGTDGNIGKVGYLGARIKPEGK